MTASRRPGRCWRAGASRCVRSQTGTTRHRVSWRQNYASALYREQTLLREVLGEVRRPMPFELLGFDTDNDTAFINETLRDYCRGRRHALPAVENDQAFVGHRRLESLEAAAALSRLDATTRL